jgi:hypothetical protein
MMPTPGYYSWYPSAMCSPWYCWFVELGYPLLDIRRWEDGEWAILQYHTMPYLPSTTKWHWVLQDLKNIDITPGFVRHWVEMLDITRKAVWDREDEKTKEVTREHAALERHCEDMVNRAHDIIMRSPELLERIAKYGMEQLDLAKIAMNIPRYKF